MIPGQEEYNSVLERDMFPKSITLLPLRFGEC